MFTESVRTGAAASEEAYMKEEKEITKREERKKSMFRSGYRCSHHLFAISIRSASKMTIVIVTMVSGPYSHTSTHG